jgi:hypothetical protein
MTTTLKKMLVIVQKPNFTLADKQSMESYQKELITKPTPRQ